MTQTEPKKTGLLHHGLCRGEFEPRYVGADYFAFYHKPDNGYAMITAILIDNRGRAIFNLRCEKCGEEDALKTSPRLWTNFPEDRTIEFYHLSPKLRSRIGRHSWDNL